MAVQKKRVELETLRVPGRSHATQGCNWFEQIACHVPLTADIVQGDSNTLLPVAVDLSLHNPANRLRRQCARPSNPPSR